MYRANSMDEPVWAFTAFTKGGAWVLAKRYVKMGSTLVEEPIECDDGWWVFMVSNPFLSRG